MVDGLGHNLKASSSSELRISSSNKGQPEGVGEVLKVSEVQIIRDRKANQNCVK